MTTEQNETYQSLFDRVSAGSYAEYEKVCGLIGYIRKNFSALNPEFDAAERALLEEQAAPWQAMADQIANMISYPTDKVGDEITLSAPNQAPDLQGRLYAAKNKIRLFTDNVNHVGAAVWQDYGQIGDPDYEWGDCLALFKIEGNFATKLAICSNCKRDVTAYDTIFDGTFGKIYEEDVNRISDAIGKHYKIV